MQRKHSDTLEIKITPSGETLISKENLKKISLPFFVGKKNNSQLYILGTVHNLPLSSLQQSVFPYIQEAKFALFEDVGKNKLTIKKLYEINFLTHEEDDEWYEDLSDEALNNLNHLVTRFFHERLNVPPFPLKHINPELVFYMCLLARRPKNPGGIDGELAKLFGNHADSLEGLERYDFLKSLEKVSLNQLESFLTSDLIIDINEKFPFNFERAKRNFRWIHKIIQVSTHSESPILVVVGKAHLEGPTGIIALLNRFGFEFSFLHEDKMQNYTVPTIEDKGTRLLEKIDSTISYQLKHTFFSLIPNIRSVEIISNYLSFSIFPEHSKTLSEEIQILGNEFGPKIKLK